MVLALLAFVYSPATAADVDSYTPSSSQVAGTGTLSGESPTTPSEGAAAGVLMGFVQNPAVRRLRRDSVEEVVAAMVPITLYGGWTQPEIGRLDVFLPVYGHVEAPETGHSAAALGDLRVQSILPITERGEVSIGAIPRIELPLGTRDALVRRGLSAGAHVAVGGAVGQANWIANVGFTASPVDKLEGVALGSTADLVLGGWMHVTDSFRVGGDLDTHLGLSRAANGANTVGTAQVFAQQLVDQGWGMTLGAGSGLSRGVGTPEYRVLFGLHYGAQVQDPDGDGLTGDADACPSIPEDPDGHLDDDGCPDEDNDGDGVVDADDRCPTEAEDLDGYEDNDGCIDEDNDGDGIADGADACPDTAGEGSGCPDADGDGIADDMDACPRQPKPELERPQVSDGCPKRVYMTNFLVAHDDPLRFVERTADLEPDAIGVISLLASILEKHPEVSSVEIQGHVDNSGSERGDKALSRMRAEAVRAALVEQGIEERRLTTRGLGHSDPVDSAETEEARQANQRIVLRIMKVAHQSAPEPAGDADEPGKLSVALSGGGTGTVFVDATRIERSAPFTDLPILPGQHTIRLTNIEEGIDEVKVIQVAPGELVRVVFDPAEASPVAPVIDVIDAPTREAGGKRPPRKSKKR